jgi:molybdenum cofactor cytidylyltransferase
MSVRPPDSKDQSPKIKDQVTAIVLAAGRSRRMGAFKPLLPFGDSTVIESCIDGLRLAGIESIVVVVGHRGEEIQTRLRNQNLTFAINPDPDSEMSSSIACGIELLNKNSKALLITPVDLPAVPPEVVTLLLKEWMDGARLVQPEHGDRGGHPVLLDLAYRPELLALDPLEGLRAFFNSHRAEVRRVPVDSPYVARDMDTWEDYRQLHEDVFGGAPPVS